VKQDETAKRGESRERSIWENQESMKEIPFKNSLERLVRFQQI
jgi:hypothetical protein